MMSHDMRVIMRWGVGLAAAFFLLFTPHFAHAEAQIGADIVVESVTFDPPNPQAGEPVDIVATVTNIGDEMGVPGRIHLWVDPADNPPTDSTPPTSELNYGLPLPPGGRVTVSRTGHVFSADGVYPVWVRVGVEDGTAETDETNNLTGPIELVIGDEGCAADSFEPDDDQTMARPLAADGTLQAHNFCVAGDEDWHELTLSGGTYRFETHNLGVDVDTILSLYDDNGVLIDENDDGGVGLASLIAFTVTDGAAGTYYVAVRPYNSQQFGADATYDVTASVSSAATPLPPTPIITPTVTPPPPTVTPAPATHEVLIVVHEARLSAQFGDVSVLMGRLDDLAATANGLIIELSNDAALTAAYDSWDSTTGMDNVTAGNDVADLVRDQIMAELNTDSGIAHIVLVGDDRMIPFRRVPDQTSAYPEGEYFAASNNNPTGIALLNDHFLTDDFYADQSPITVGGEAVYLPDFGIGRLIETPDDMLTTIDAYLASDTIRPDDVLVVGYDFVEDTARLNCTDWTNRAGADDVDCTLIGNSYTLDQYEALHINSDHYLIQSINTHAAHYAEGTPNYGLLMADTILNAPVNLAGGLIYSFGCHTGLNVPDNNVQPLDLPQAYASHGINYVANTAYAWAYRGSVGLSEQMMRNYTAALTENGSTTIGDALHRAKSLYFTQQAGRLDTYDQKTIQQLVLYGLPMMAVQSHITSSLNTAVDVNIATATIGGLDEPNQVTFDRLMIDVNRSVSATETAFGTLYALDGDVIAEAGQPIQPAYFYALPNTAETPRSILFTGGKYDMVPTTGSTLFAVPILKDLSKDGTTVYETAATTKPVTTGIYPPLPVTLGTHNDTANVTVALGQFTADTNTQWLYSTVTADLYYGTSSDHTAPMVTAVNSYVDNVGAVQLKLNATDGSGVARVVVAYTDMQGSWSSVDLTVDKNGSWTGTYPQTATSRYFVQVVDTAGNITADTNNDQYYTPDEATTDTTTPLAVHLTQTGTHHTNKLLIALILIPISPILWTMCEKRNSLR